MKIKLTATQYRAIKGNERRNGDARAKRHAKEIKVIVRLRTKTDVRKDTRAQRMEREAKKWNVEQF